MICVLNAVQPLEIVEPGPPTGIILQDAPGILVTDCYVHTQRVFVRLDPADVYKKHVTGGGMVPWHVIQWSKDIIGHAQLDTIHMLKQLQKVTITQEELRGVRRPKRFLGTLLTAASALGSLFSVGTSTVNSISISTLGKNVEGLKREMPEIQEKMYVQQEQLQQLDRTLEGTILVVNQHTALLNYTIHSIGKIVDVIQHDYAHVQKVQVLMQDLLREVSSVVDSLALNRIPSYLVPVELVRDILNPVLQGTTQTLQVHLAYSLGSAIPIHVNPEAQEIGFLLNLPIINTKNIYRLKSVLNVGFWSQDIHIKIETPSLIAYQDENPDMYLTPNLHMCTVVKDIHWLCPSKPFVRDPIEGLCGIKRLTTEDRCNAVATYRDDVTTTQIEKAGNKWLVNTPVSEAIMTYNRHDTATPIHLPNETMLIQIPVGAILHIKHLALYHLDADVHSVEFEITDAFKGHTLAVDNSLRNQVLFEGPKLAKISLQLGSLQATPVEPKPKRVPFTWGWDISDSLLLIFTLCGWATMGLLGWTLYQRIHKLQVSLSEQESVRPSDALELKSNMCRPLPELSPVITSNSD